jgi:hypothetical protein
VKIREWLKKLRLQPTPLEGGDRRPDNVDGLATMSGGQYLDSGSVGPTPAPPNWVPSQQDERPRH